MTSFAPPITLAAPRVRLSLVKVQPPPILWPALTVTGQDIPPHPDDRSDHADEKKGQYGQ
jgi:hypothetical protein